MAKPSETQEEFEELMDDIEKQLDDVVVTEFPEPTLPHDARTYRGTTSGGWGVLVISFDISDQGFPEGARGADGTVMKDGMIIRLPTHLAERVAGIEKVTDWRMH